MTQICPSQLQLTEGTGHPGRRNKMEGLPRAAASKQNLGVKVKHTLAEKGILLDTAPHITYTSKHQT